MALNGLQRKADAVKPQILKPRQKLSSVKARWPRPMTSSQAFAFEINNMPRIEAKHVKMVIVPRLSLYCT